MLCYNLQDFNRSFDDLLVGPHVRTFTSGIYDTI